MGFHEWQDVAVRFRRRHAPMAGLTFRQAELNPPAATGASGMRAARSLGLQGDGDGFEQREGIDWLLEKALIVRRRGARMRQIVTSRNENDR